MNLPLQVQRQVERANQLLNQDAPNGEPAPQPEPNVVAPEVPEVPAPESEEAPPSPAPAAEPAPEPAPPAPDNWEQKYRTLQGVFNAESTKWKATNRDLQAKVNDLEAQVAASKATPAAAPVADANDLELYGADMMAAINRAAAKIVDEKMADLKPQLEQTRAQVTNLAEKQYKDAEDEFYGELSTAVPDWRTINEDQKWLEWLAEVDPIFGFPRQQALDHAGQNLNHAQAANLFNAYKTAAGLNRPAPAPTPARPAVSPSPRPVGASSAPSMREPDTSVRRSEIRAHYARAPRDMTYRASPEAKAFEARMNVALAANKVVED